MQTKPSLPKGTRDFGPEIMLRRNFILDIIKNVYREFGFLALETPAMENLSVLTGKYGDEGDQLLYRILNSGDFLKNTDEVNRNNSTALSPFIAEKGLRYDLTVPFARFVASNRHELTLPFKRYQIQPVWRADRPQRGRYREFYQCDADVVGSDSLLCEAEIIIMINKVFQSLGITEYEIRVNHRSLLEGICQMIGAEGALPTLSTAIDKLDKIGWDGVSLELKGKGMNDEQMDTLALIFHRENKIKLEELLSTLGPDLGQKGREDMKEFFRILNSFDPKNKHLVFDVSLARGLSYYTGMIFEVLIPSSGVGSVAGGGRYDDLTSMFGVEPIPGVGFSFGVDRLYDAMETLQLFPKETLSSTKVLIVHFDEESMNYGLKVLNGLRNKNLACELYPDNSKLKKQLSYAHKKGIPFVIVIGSDEVKSEKLKLKNMETGDEKALSVNEIISTLSS